MNEIVTRYKIGQILTSKEDVEIEKGFSGEKVIIPKGNKVMIGADKLAHHLKDGMIQPLPEDTEVKGYDTENIASVVFDWLQYTFSIAEYLDEVGSDREEFCKEIEWALSEYVGM